MLNAIFKLTTIKITFHSLSIVKESGTLNIFQVKGQLVVFHYLTFVRLKVGRKKMEKKFLQYGTAGFRCRAEDLDSAVFRIGMLGVLRSKKKNGETVGIIITASHNPESDNGVKLIDPNGGMLDESWEEVATTMANAEDEHLEEIVNKIVQKEKINMDLPANVFIGRDTRKSSNHLMETAIKGIIFLKGSYQRFGVVTTPVLHFLVNMKNEKNIEPNQKDYNAKLVKAFIELNKDGLNANSNYIPEVLLDCSNGVGALKAKEFADELKDFLNIRIYNEGNGVLNHKCGSEYVKVEKKYPEGMPVELDAKCVSLDGDADRIVYYYTSKSNKLQLLDGDRIAILMAKYIIELVRQSCLDLNVGIVQTAYSNGNSTKYISNVLQIPHACVPTGVKYLHKKALEFDIGIYFEANGHGSVLYSKSAEEKIRNKAETTITSDDERQSVEKLCLMIDLTNQTVGDALCDLLIVETILRAKNMNILDWKNMYDDYPSRLLKVSVKDRFILKTNSTETICLEPPNVQEVINSLVSKVPEGRSFIRPSGTEDIVRVYAEATTQKAADELALEVAKVVYKMIEGVGELPTI